jgi:PTH1 family peptidyl-tRNA hydrolase
MFYIVGLGNPGEKYTDTRHNVGQAYLEQFNTLGSLAWNKSKPASAQYAKATIAGQPVEFVLPETFMNKSGDTLAYYVQKHGAKPEECIVLHDDVDLAIGEIKISKGRGDGGNNGIKSIIARLDSKEFVRVRIGIAPRHWWTGEVKRPKAGVELERFVLQSFNRKERAQLEVVYKTIDAAIEVLVTDGPEKAMNQFN